MLVPTFKQPTNESGNLVVMAIKQTGSCLKAFCRFSAKKYRQDFYLGFISKKIQMLNYIIACQLLLRK